MSALDRKLWRDLWHLRGQALAIALVLACGVATYVMFLATLDTLERTRTDFYRDYRFAQVFCSLKRAPERIGARIATLPGVERVDTRVVAPVTIDLPDFDEPVTGIVTSIPDQGEPTLNRLYLKSGRSVAGGRSDEVVVSEAFAAAHHLHIGDRLSLVIKGRRKRLRIVGTAVSPEYISQLRPGSAFPDFKRYAVLWMARTPLASAYDMDGGFNDVVLTLTPGASEQDVIERVDRVLARFGGLGAYGREDQSSNRFLSAEIKQLRNSSAIFPVIFLGVAAFLLYVVVSRLVGTQREQIATLKAVGYSDRAVAAHYLKLVLVIVAFGAALGLGLGAWLTGTLAALYTTFFRLPYLRYALPARVVGGASLVSLAAGLLGAWSALRAAVRLRPAQAMRPEAPTAYRETLVERLGLRRALSAATRMILRHLAHRPLKSALTVLGIALACAITTTGRFQRDTVSFMMHVHYDLTQRQDLSVTFVEPTSRRVLHDLLAIPGVIGGEVYRSVPVRLRHGHYSERTVIEGLEPGGELQRLLDTRHRSIPIPAQGIVLTDYLGRLLRVRPGALLTVEVLEGERPVRQVRVAALVKQYLGLSGYMDLAALNRLMREGPAVSGAYLSVDRSRASAINRRLKEMPRIAGIAVRSAEIANFKRIMEETLLFWTSLATVFAMLIAFGVIYNSARITLTERSRELASLRVLGFTRGEISYILLGELALLTLAALPVGLLIGRALCGLIASMIQSDLYRVPLIIEPDTYAFAAVVVLAASAVSALLVRRRLDRLDLIGVLKARD